MTATRHVRSAFAAAALALLAGPSAGFATDAGSESPARSIGLFIDYMAENHRFDRQALTRLLPRQPNPNILTAITPSNTAERKSWKRYRENFVNPGRISRGVAFWNAQADALAIAESRFGVPAEIIVAIIGVETNYGRQTGGFSALDALATLAFHYPPRAPYFQRELVAFLLHAREQGLDPQRLKGSYAGATGIPQFMPSSIRAYAIDFDGDRRIDLANSQADAIGSVAAFLEHHGWRPDGRIAHPATLDEPPPEHWLAAGIKPSLAGTLSLWQELADRAPEEVALIALTSPGEAGDEYWWGFHNLYVISHYNRSSSYAMAVYLLAQAVRAARENPTGPANPARLGSRGGPPGG